MLVAIGEYIALLVSDEKFIYIMGWFGMVFFVIYFVPQLYLMWKKKTDQDELKACQNLIQRHP